MDLEGNVDQVPIFVYDSRSPDVTVFPSIHQAEISLEPNDLDEHLLIYDEVGRRLLATPRWSDYSVHIQCGESVPTHLLDLHHALIAHFRAAAVPEGWLEQASTTDLIERALRVGSKYWGAK